tara:strand:- start:816 stop:1418 length:603 start_codon:yes stop_codon:yes gene_type:complete
MKIAITGHTSGVGKSLYDKLVGLGHTVFGYSRANGFDLSNKDQVAKLVKKIVYRENINYTKGGFEYEDDDVDVFINNAYYNWSQVDLLYKVYEPWRDKDKIIINIGSVTGDSSKKYMHEYQVHKVALDNACKQLQPLGKCKVINVRPGWVDTNFNPKKTIPKDIEILKPDQVADIVLYILNQPKEICIKTISVEPWYKDE